MSVVIVVLNSQSELCKIQHGSFFCYNIQYLGKHVIINCYVALVYFYSFSILSSTDWAMPNKIIKVSFVRKTTWAGHVPCVSKKRIAQRVLVGKPEGKRPRGRPKSSRNLKVMREPVLVRTSGAC